MYYYDLKEFTRYFDPDLRIDLEFGDVVDVPAMPSIVKDRPIAGDNSNGVLFKLNKFRHFHMPADDVAFADKLPVAVWRALLRCRNAQTDGSAGISQALSEHRPAAALSLHHFARRQRCGDQLEMGHEFEFAVPDAAADI